MTVIAINPLPWFLGPHGEPLLTPESLDEALGVLVRAGFGAVSIAIPEGMSPSDYLAALATQTVVPAAGYFGADLHDEATRDSVVEAAVLHARQHRELGVTQTFIASNLSPERILLPAQGALADPVRTAVIAETVGQVMRAMADEGVTACLHPHVGSWIETEEEIDQVMAAVPELRFGPDTGHLFWAGMDPARVMQRYSGRLGGVHIKDASLDAMKRALDARLDYFDAAQLHVWTELGEGDVDLVAALATVPDDFDGWLVVEVDVPSAPTAEESTLASGEWIRRNVAVLPDAEETPSHV
ncbi:sugar phosphate isomerase/epimerase family protein [Subtercola frigoramans]|uniref:Inosose dehydratase n=1 Tax=Subtercola frigoramans TaxID=120298 RepID=A0ABS2L082_9MICO|nr:sugar phosphate isomerase/epimerase [Subtercola frigoramans]MBM7470488.1 inosose dehydratase [Subtercola frigoramans]